MPAPAEILRVGVVQMRMSDNPNENVRRALEKTREAAEKGAEVICLPELFRSRYFCQVEDADLFDLAEAVPGPTTEAFAALGKELGVTVIVSLFERRARGLYHNTAAVVDGERGYLGKYRKMHIPDDPRFYEKFYFAPGDLGFKTFPTEKANLGVLVCWDQWYPEAARLTAMKGAEVLFYPTAIGWHPEEREAYGVRQHGAWETAQRAHAIANGCFVVAVNRTGFEPTPGQEAISEGKQGIQFWGQSFVCAPDGHVLYRAPEAEEAVEVVELDLGEMESSRRGWPFLRDRRIDAYAGLDRRYLDEE